MAPIDYSKWDKIETDSEPEVESSPAQPPQPQPQESQPAPQQASSEPDSVKAVIVRCNLEKRGNAPWSATTIPTDHPVFAESVPAIPALVEVPLVLYRKGTQSANQADLDNQIATYLNIDASRGFAPPEWQSHVGTVIVARKDRKPLLPQHLEGLWMYCDRILDLFGDGEGAPRRLYSRQAFERWWNSYCREQRGFRSGTRGEVDPDDWREVRSPYEV
jgi:hypothetical protein